MKGLLLQTPEERVRLLKNGVEMKKIEELYIRYNRLKVIKSPILFDFIETTMQSCISPDAPEIKLEQIYQGTDGDENSKILPPMLLF
jgi:hypothetical protein